MNKLDTVYALDQLIRAMGWEDDVNFKDTSTRVTTWLYGYQSLDKHNCVLKSVQDLSKRFPTTNHNMVVVGPTKVFSLCHHHLLPIEYDV